MYKPTAAILMLASAGLLGMGTKSIQQALDQKPTAQDRTLHVSCFEKRYAQQDCTAEENRAVLKRNRFNHAAGQLSGGIILLTLSSMAVFGQPNGSRKKPAATPKIS